MPHAAPGESNPSGAVAGDEPRRPDGGAYTAEELADSLGSGPAGLSTDEAARRLRAHGPNRIERVRRRFLALRLLAQFTGFFARLLWVAGICAFIARLPELGWAIFAVILVNGLFSFLQEYRAERAVEVLERLLPSRITVRRDGRDLAIEAAAIVPGDRVRLEEGDQVPADGHVLEASGLRVDQSALTGESRPVWKRTAAGDPSGPEPRLERHDLVFAGSGVVSGTGLLLVTATGMRTEIGRIAHLTQAVAEAMSPLQVEMSRVTRVVTILAVSAGAAFFTLGVASGRLRPAEGFVFAIGVIVANVPEGLLPTLTLALALGVQRMARKGSVVKRLSAVESIGATTVICTDKTGTLTQNRMEVRHVRPPDGANESARRVLEVASLASSATSRNGDPTEVAIVRAAEAEGIDIEGSRAAREIARPYPFEAFRKRMTLVRREGGSLIAYAKGAPRETLALCTRAEERGEAVALDPARRAAILAEHDRMADEGHRMLAVAIRTWEGDAVPPEGAEGAALVERDLTFLGLLALWDPPRPEVADALAVCGRAGIRVVMITGDYGLTARAVARRIGLQVGRVVTGAEIERMPSQVLVEVVAEPGILFARTSPSHKLALVKALQTRGEVVTVTGDGVNDAPALKAAAIGAAMGLRGTEVAKEAADIVILDDNFASIVTAVRLGRTVRDNIGKFITYHFASNVPELVPLLASVFLGIPLPLTIMQILAIDLGTDLLPALALGAEPSEAGIMDRPPRRRDEPILSRGRLGRAYGYLGVAEAALALAAFFWTYWLAGWRPGEAMASAGPLYARATTMTFLAIVAAQIGNVFACRTERESVFRVGLWRNRFVVGGVAAELALVLALLALPPTRAIFGLEPPRPAEWGLLLAFPPAMLGLEELRKGIVRRRARRRGGRNETSPGGVLPAGAR